MESLGRVARVAMSTWFLIYLELPAVVGFFILIGYIIGKRYGDWYGLLGIWLGGTLGFITGAIGLIRLLGIIDRNNSKQLGTCSDYCHEPSQGFMGGTTSLEPPTTLEK